MHAVLVRIASLVLDMIFSCFHTLFMSSMIQIRNVPATMHRRLKARAALEGVSMSQYVLAAVERALERPSRRELLASIRRQPSVVLDTSPAEVLRAERLARDEQVDAAERRRRHQ